METTKKPLPRSADEIVTRAWHVVMANGGDVTVTAHRCTIRDGVLLFRNAPPPSEEERSLILVRAFGREAWDDCALIDTPHAPAVQRPASAGIGTLNHGLQCR
jgi:hypothetical protein